MDLSTQLGCVRSVVTPAAFRRLPSNRIYGHVLHVRGHGLSQLSDVTCREAYKFSSGFRLMEVQTPMMMMKCGPPGNDTCHAGVRDYLRAALRSF